MKYRTKKKLASLDARFRRELKLQKSLRLHQFDASDKYGKQELIDRAGCASVKFLKMAKPITYRVNHE